MGLAVVVFCSGLAALSPVSVPGQSIEDFPRIPGDYLNKIPHNLVTPHREFARPYAGGAVRALFIVPQRGAAREVVELFQRLSLDYDAVTTVDSKMFAPTEKDYGGLRFHQGGWFGEKEAELRAKLAQEPQVTVIGNFSWASIPAEERKTILEKVRKGMGLVIAHPRDIPKDVTSLLVPDAEGNEEIRRGTGAGRWQLKGGSGAFNLGAGRVVLLNFGVPPETGHGAPGFTPQWPYNFNRANLYRQGLSVAARSVLWAAAREPDVRILLEPSYTGKWGAELKITPKVSSARQGRFLVPYQVHDVQGRLLFRGEKRVEIREGEGNLPSISIPSLPQYDSLLLDIWIKEGGKTVDWACTVIGVTDGKIKEVAFFPKDVVRKGETIRAEVGLSGPLQEGEQLVLWVKDCYGRIIKEIKPSPYGKQNASAVFTFWLDELPTLALRMEVALLSGDRLMASRERVLYAPWRPRRDFNFIVWGQNGYGILANYLYDSWKSMGATTILRWPHHFHSPVLSYTDLLNLAYAYATNLHPTDKHYVEQPHAFDFECWEHADCRTLFLKKWQDWTRWTYKYGVLGYSLGDEVKIGGPNVGYSEGWMDPFRRHMQAVYKNLDALNAEWETDFSSWDEVEPLKKGSASTRAADLAQLKEVYKSVDRLNRELKTDYASWEEVEQARQKSSGSYAPYIDHRLWVEGKVAEMLVKLGEICKGFDPEGRVGFEGATSVEAYYGLDFAKLSPVMSIQAPYYTPVRLWLMDGFIKPGAVTGSWTGGYVWCRRVLAGEAPKSFNRVSLWETLLSGVSGIYFFAADSPEGGVNRDYSPAEDFPVEEARTIMGGLGEYLVNCEHDYDPVAMLYSRASVQVHSFERPWGRAGMVLNNWLALLWDIGLHPRPVSSQQLAGGILEQKGISALILPEAVALSEAEVKVIREFVERGGILIADLRPGCLSGHGKYLKSGALDDLFGVKRASTRAREVAALDRLEAKGDIWGQHVDMELRQVTPEAVAVKEREVLRPEVDRSVRVAGAEAHLRADDGTPVWIANSCGKGRTLLLNCSVTSYAYFSGGRSKMEMWRYPEQNKGLREGLRDVLAAAGVTSRFPAQDSQGRAAVALRRRCFHRGAVRLLGVTRSLRKHMAPGPVTVGLPQRLHVYDVRRRKYLGHTQEVTIDLRRGDGTFLSLLPYKVQRLEGSMTEPRRGEDVRLRLNLVTEGKTAPGDHMVRITVRDGRQKRLLWFDKLVWLTGGKAQASLRVALNESAGNYTLEALDVLSDAAWKREFSLPEKELPGKVLSSPGPRDYW